MSARFLRIFSIVVVALLMALPGRAALECESARKIDQAHYSWDLGGGIAWLVGLAFPSSGTGTLRTETRGDVIVSELEVRDKKGKDSYRYESEMTPGNLEAMMSYHGYSWGNRSRDESTMFDYKNHTATIRRDSSKNGKAVWEKSIPHRGLRDVLGGIHFLRTNAHKIKQTIDSEIYSDGDLYPIQYKPLGVKQGRMGGKNVTLRGFQIVARPGDGDKWPGGVTIWLTLDARAIPVEISIVQPLVSMDLVLTSFESCSG